MIGPQDNPPAEDQEYIDRVIVPLALGYGVACFFAHPKLGDADLTPNAISAKYSAGKGAAIDPNPLTRAREALRGQVEAREMAAKQGYEAVIL